MIAVISDVSRRFVQNCRAERVYRQLGAMDRRMLRDVGLDDLQARMMSGLADSERSFRD
jgi:hypothetical protein